ncbi:MAG: efflux RND transporter permease subunit [Pseudomonadota bacterium]
MKLTEICIKRPVLATVLSLLLVILGLVTFNRLQVRQYPRVDYPVISVTTRFEGASPDIVETQVTKTLENALAGIEGIDEMRSTSMQSQSSITLKFSSERDIESAANDVRDKVSRARTKLPQDVHPPEIRKADVDANAMMFLTLYSDTQETKDVADYVKRVLEDQIEVVGGVASVEIWGGGDYEMFIRLDPMRLAAYRMTAEDVSHALREQNIEKSAGRLITKEKDILITTKAPLKTEEQFRNVIIKEHEGYLVRISDVVDEVKFDSIEDRYSVRFNGKEAVAMAIFRQSVANPLAVAKEIKKMLPKIRSDLPEGMHIDIAVDHSVFIERSIDEVYRTIFEAAILVMLVIFVFLRSMRAALIPIVTIPLSLIGTFALMYLFGFTINVLTLLALVMAIGLVVDDAIVVLENIYRHIENGMSPMQATIKGSKEIGSAVVAMTITLAAVYAPVALIPGMTGKIFTEFALTLAGAVVLSGFVALTLSPMMCGRLLKIHRVKITKDDKVHHPIKAFFKRIDLWIDRTLEAVDRKYKRWLVVFINGDSHIPFTNREGKKMKTSNRILVLSVGILIAAIGGYIGFSMKQDLSPYEDHGYVKARAFPPRGASLDYINKYVKQAEDIFLKEVPEMDRILSIIEAQGGDNTTLEAYLVPWEDRSRSSMAIAKEMGSKLTKITGLSFNVWGRGRSLVAGGSRFPVDIVVQSTKSYEDLVKLFHIYEKRLAKEVPGLTRIEHDAPSDEQEFVINIDRDKAASLGVKVLEIADMLAILSGRPATFFKTESYRYPVTIQLAKKFRRTKEDIASLYIRGRKPYKRDEAMIPLSEIITIEKKLAPTVISHFGGLKSLRLYAGVKPDYGLGEVLNQAMVVAKRTLPEGAKIDYGGESKRFFEESANIILIFILALISIYLVLSAQYESFVDPLVILVSVPLSLVGGVITLKYLGGTFNFTGSGPFFEAATLTIFGKIGLITLVGLITKHGILIVEFANQLLESGDAKNRPEAVIKASKARLRPILMTTFAMVLGAVPLALASGAGSESRQQIGWVVVGGMSIGTLFTLFIVPIVYTYLSRDNIAMVYRNIMRKLSFS